MRNVLESTTIIDHYPAVIDRYFKHRHSIHKGPFHIYICIYIFWSLLFLLSSLSSSSSAWLWLWLWLWLLLLLLLVVGCWLLVVGCWLLVVVCWLLVVVCWLLLLRWLFLQIVGVGPATILVRSRIIQ